MNAWLRLILIIIAGVLTAATVEKWLDKSMWIVVPCMAIVQITLTILLPRGGWKKDERE